MDTRAAGAGGAVGAGGAMKESWTPTTQKCRIQGHKTCVMAGNQSMKLISN